MDHVAISSIHHYHLLKSGIDAIIENKDYIPNDALILACQSSKDRYSWWIEASSITYSIYAGLVEYRCRRINRYYIEFRKRLALTHSKDGTKLRLFDCSLLVLKHSIRFDLKILLLVIKILVNRLAMFNKSIHH